MVKPCSRYWGGSAPHFLRIRTPSSIPRSQGRRPLPPQGDPVKGPARRAIRPRLRRFLPDDPVHGCRMISPLHYLPFDPFIGKPLHLIFDLFISKIRLHHITLMMHHVRSKVFNVSLVNRIPDRYNWFIESLKLHFKLTTNLM